MRKNVSQAIVSRIFMFVVAASLSTQTIRIYGQAAGVVAFNKDTEIGVSMAISPDEKHAYAGGMGSILVFERRANGTLHVVQVLNNSHHGIEGISDVADMIVSRDGRHLYAINMIESRVNLFARDSISGQIRLLDFFADEIFGADVMHNISHYELIQNPDGARLYWLNTNGDSNRAHNVLAVLERDSTTGKLNILQTLHGGEAELGFYQTPLALTMTPDARNLYGCGNNGPFLLEFRSDTLSGKITWTKALAVNLETVRDWDRGSITTSPEGKFIYATNMFADKLFVIARSLKNNTLKLQTSLFLSNPSTSFISPNGDFLYLLNSGGITAFAREVSTGNLFQSGTLQLRNATSPHNFVATRIGNNVYLNVHINVNGSNLQTLESDPDSGDLKVVQQINDLGGTDRLSGGRAIEVSPNGKHLFVGTDHDAAISVFARDEAQGRLALHQADSEGRISAMKLSPQGEHLYATTQNNEIKIFALDHKSGALQLVQMLTDTVRQYHTLAFAPDGRQLYLADFNRIKVFARDPASGLLTGVQSFTRSGLWHNHATTLEVASEGKHAYWQNEHKIFILKRDLSNGKLAFGDSLLMSLPGYDFVGGQHSLQISPEGRHVYVGVTAYKYFDDDSYFEHIKIMFFERNPLSGVLTFVEAVAQREWGNWNKVIDLVLSADGKDLYAVLDFDGDSNFGLAMLTRDLESGKLSQRAFFAVTKGGVYGYDSPLTDMALSPDGAFLYFTDQLGVMTFATGRRVTSRVNENNALGVAPPRTLTLAQNYPNPFSVTSSSRATIIDYEIVTSETSALPIELAIYNIQGQQVATLVRQTQARGKYSVAWNGMNARGESVPSGIYFYRLKAGEQITTRKLMLLQ